MADQQPPTGPTTPAPGDTPQPPAPKKSRWGRRLLIGGGVLVLLLIILVALIPTIASTAFVRNVVVGKVNETLNGRVAIDDWSLSWSGGVDASGVSVLDPNGQTVIDLRKLRTELSLFDAIKGRYNLGKVTVDGLRVNVVVNEDGTNNLQNLAKPSETQPAADAGSGMPNLQADLILTDCQANVSGPGVPQPIAAAFAGQVTVTDINQPITDSLSATLAIANQPAGKIDLSGTADLFENGKYDERSAAIAQKLNLQGVQLASIAPFLPKTAVTQLAGTTDGQFALDLKGGSSGTLEGQLSNRNLTVTGPALSGDTFQTDELALAVPSTTIAMPNGLGDWQSYRVRTGGDAAAPIVVSLGNAPGGADLGRLQVTMDAAVQAVLNTAAGKAPGSDGKVQTASNLDLAALSRMLPKSLNLVEGVQLQSGTMAQQTTIALTPASGALQTTTDLSAITGTDTRNGNRPITIRPIHLDAAATAGGGGVTDFRNVSLNLTSGFATAAFKGQTLADLAGQARGDLKQMRDELGQVVDFGALDLAGTFDMTLASTGNLAAEGGQGKVETRLTLQNLRVAGLAAGKTIDQKWMNVAAAGTLTRGKEKFIDAVKDGTVTVRTGDPNNPTIDVATVANVNLAGASPTIGFAVQKLFVDAPRAQAEFAAFVPGDYRVTAGTINAAATGTWSGSTLTLDNFSATPSNLTVNLQSKDGRTTPVVTALTMAIETAGTVATGDQQTINLSKLNVAESQRRLVLQKVSDGPLVLTSGPAGFSGNGKLQVGADLAFLNSIVNGLSAGNQQVVAQSKSGDLRSGTLDGTLAFDSAAGKPTTLAGDFKIANLVVTTATGATQPENVTLALQATAPADFSSVSAQNVALQSRFANLNVTDSLLLLKQPSGQPVGTYDQLQKANVTLDVPDVGAFYAIASAFTPPAPAGQTTPTLRQRVEGAAGPVGSQVISRAADAAGRPLPAATTAEQLAGPLSVTGGRLAAKLAVARANGATTVNVSELSGGDIQLRRGAKSYAVEPFSLQLAASLKNAGDQIAQIDLSQLSGKLGVADLAMEQPISIKNPTGDQMAATGAVRLAGNLRKTSDLLEVLNGQPMPYAGTYTLVQKLNTTGPTVGLTGNIDLANFQVLDETGRVSFAEDKVAITNDVKIDQQAKNLAGSLNVNSQALGMKFNGGVNQFDSARRITDGTTLALNYDAAKVWQIVKPMLSPETQASTADLQVAGVKQANFTLAGAFPANVPFEQAIRQLSASGALPLDSLQTHGITAQQINPGFTLAGGKLTVTAAPGAQPVQPPVRPPAPGATTQQALPPLIVTAMVNGGTVDLTNAVIDLTTAEPTLSMPPNKALAANVALSGVLAEYANLGVIPIFDPNAPAAVADVTVLRCENFPLGQSMRLPQSPGVLELVVSLANVKPGGPLISGIDKFAGGALGAQLQATVQPTRIAIANGTARVDNFSLAFGEKQHQYLKFSGTAGLGETGRLDLVANLPSDLMARFGDDVRKYLPKGIDLPIGGTRAHPEFAAADRLIASLVKQAAANAAAAAITGGGKDGKQGGGNLGDILGNVIGGGGGQQQQQQQQPAQRPQQQRQQQPAQQQQQPNNAASQQNQPAAKPAEPTAGEAIGGLLDALTRDRDKKPAAEPEPAQDQQQQQQQRRRNRQQQQQQQAPPSK